MKTAVVTITIGERYEAMAEITHPTIKAYANKIGAEFIVWRHYHPHSYPYYQKLEVKSLFGQAGYDRVLFIDTDIIVRDDTPDLFEVVPEDAFAAFNEFPFKPRIDTMRSFLSEAQLTQWLAKNEYLNTGVFVCSRQHGVVFEHTGDEVNEFYEQSYLNYRIHALGVKTMHLSPRYNRMGWMDFLTGKSKYDAYCIHYAGLSIPVAQLVAVMRDDLEVWERASPSYRYPVSWRLRFGHMSWIIKSLLRRGITCLR